MGVYLHMNIGQKKFNLGRSYRYIDGDESKIDTNLENLYTKKQLIADDLEKKIIAMAAHHPTKEELQEFCYEIADMITGYADDLERIGRCMTLAELVDNDEKIEFKVE